MTDEATIELYNSWRKHPITEVLFASLQQEIESVKESWLDGHFTHEGNADATFLVQARQQERARVYREFINRTGEEFLQLVGGE
jgi:hypothetical protein